MMMMVVVVNLSMRWHICSSHSKKKCESHQQASQSVVQAISPVLKIQSTMCFDAEIGPPVVAESIVYSIR